MAEERENENDYNERGKTDQDEDTGHSWIILIGSFFVYMFVQGSMKCFGLLYTEMLDTFSAGSGNTAWIGSITWFLLQAVAPLAVILAKRFSFRWISFAGGILVGCGYFLSGFVKQMELMYLTFSVVGFGYGLSNTCSATIINFYFKRRRTLANGIVVSSGGIAVLTFPFLYRFLIDKYGLSEAFWVIGAILSNICVGSCVFLQPKSLIYHQELIESNTSRIRGCNLVKKRCGTSTLKFSLFKNKRFTLLVIALALCTIGHVNNLTLIPAHIKALGYSNTYVSLGVSITGGAELIGRIFIGWFADLNIIQKIHILVGCTFVGGAFALILPFFDSFSFILVYAGVAGVFPASFHVLLSVLAIERVGLEDFPTAFGFIYFFRAFASIISLPISGWLADYFGNWHASFIFIGITLICAGIIALLEKVVTKNKYSFDMDVTVSFEKYKTNSVNNVDYALCSGENSIQSNKEGTKENGNIFKNQETEDNCRPVLATYI